MGGFLTVIFSLTGSIGTVLVNSLSTLLGIELLTGMLVTSLLGIESLGKLDQIVGLGSRLSCDLTTNSEDS